MSEFESWSHAPQSQRGEEGTTLRCLLARGALFRGSPAWSLGQDLPERLSSPRGVHGRPPHPCVPSGASFQEGGPSDGRQRMVAVVVVAAEAPLADGCIHPGARVPTPPACSSKRTSQKAFSPSTCTSFSRLAKKLTSAKRQAISAVPPLRGSPRCELPGQMGPASFLSYCSLCSPRSPWPWPPPAAQRPEALLQGGQCISIKSFGSSCRGAAEMNPTRGHEVAGSTPGLAQWVKDPALL